MQPRRPGCTRLGAPLDRLCTRRRQAGRVRTVCVARACAGKPVQNYRYMADMHDIDGYDVSQILGALTDRDPAKRMTKFDFY
jgi:hypothetical protein